MLTTSPIRDPADRLGGSKVSPGSDPVHFPLIVPTCAGRPAPRAHSAARRCCLTGRDIEGHIKATNSVRGSWPQRGPKIHGNRRTDVDDTG